MQNSVKAGRVNIETLYLVEKGALLFLSINLIAASLGINKLAWSENSETEFVFGWNSWTQIDSTNSGVIVIRDRKYASSQCTLDACDANENAGTIFMVLNMLAIILLVCCCCISLEMAVFHHTTTLKKVMNAIMTLLAFTFNLTAWCFWVANSDTTALAQANAGSSTRHASSFWYSLLAWLFLSMYCLLVMKQNIANFMDKRKERDDARPLPSASIPQVRGGGRHKDKDISKLLKSRVITKEKEPAPPTIPELPRKLSSNPEEEAIVIRTPESRLSLKHVPPPLPPRTSYVTPVERLTTPVERLAPSLPRKRSRGLPSVRTSQVSKAESVESGDESVGERI